MDSKLSIVTTESTSTSASTSSDSNSLYDAGPAPPSPRPLPRSLTDPGCRNAFGTVFAATLRRSLSQCRGLLQGEQQARAARKRSREIDLLLRDEERRRVMSCDVMVFECATRQRQNLMRCLEAVSGSDQVTSKVELAAAVVDRVRLAAVSWFSDAMGQLDEKSDAVRLIMRLTERLQPEKVELDESLAVLIEDLWRDVDFCLWRAKAATDGFEEPLNTM
jgi:hypothetical protein